MKILFLATYFPRPLNSTIGTWALEQAKAFLRASKEAQLRVTSSELRLGSEAGAVTSSELTITSGNQSAAVASSTSDLAPVTSFRVVSGNPWFPKFVGRLRAGIQVYSHCPPKHSWDGVEVDYLPMLFYPFGSLDSIFNRVGEPLLRLGWWSIRGCLMKIVEEFQPDVVYAHHTVPNGYFALKIHKETGIPFVVTDHEMGEITACEIFPRRRAVYEKVIGAAHRMVSVAGVMSKDMERVFPQARCEVIHNGINLATAPSESRAISASMPATSHSFSANQPQALKLSTLDPGVSTPLVILSCGMFYERKNFLGLIQAFNLVAEKNPNVILRIFGDGPDRIKLEQTRYNSHFKDRIELGGKVAHAKVLKQMQEADIFALIGWREPFATVFLEAMAVGLPIIACNDGGIAEIIQSVELDDPTLDSRLSTLEKAKPNGLLVPPKDIAAAVKALEFLILNPEARKQIGKEAREKIEVNLTWDAVVQKYLRIFDQAKMLKKPNFNHI